MGRNFKAYEFVMNKIFSKFWALVSTLINLVLFLNLVTERFLYGGTIKKITWGGVSKAKIGTEGSRQQTIWERKIQWLKKYFVFLKKNIYCGTNIFVCVCTHSKWYLPRHSICIPNVIFAGGCTHICQIGVKIWNVFCGINVMVPISMNHCLSSPPTQ